MILTSLGALIAVAATAGFLSLGATSHTSQASNSHAAAPNFPLSQHRGPGAPPTTRPPRPTSGTRCAFVRPERRCIWVP